MDKFQNPEQLDASDLLELNKTLQTGPAYECLCKHKAKECFRNSNVKEAAYWLSQVHFTLLRQQYLTNAYYTLFEKKKDGPLNAEGIAEHHKPFLNSLEDGYKCIEDVTSLLPPSWVVIQITSQTDAFTPKSKRSLTPGLWVTRFSRDDPVVVKEVSEVPDLKVLSTLDEILVNNKVNGKKNRDFLHLYWKNRHDYNLELKSLVIKMGKNWLKDVASLFFSVTAEDKQHIRDFLQNHSITLSEQNEQFLACLVNSAQSLSLSTVDIGKFLHSAIEKRLEARVITQLAKNLMKLQKNKKTNPTPIILILDHELIRLPWDSMPFLQKTPVSRVPSMRFLKALLLQQKRAKDFEINSMFYLLNPGDDLPKTEEKILKYLKDKDVWEGITGRQPTYEELAQAITERDLYLYCGHGSGSQYISKERVQLLQCRTIPLLMGCSSGHLSQPGKCLEASGVASSYILAGCMNLVGFLWEVSDKQCDNMTTSLLNHWLYTEDKSSLASAVMAARKASELFLDEAGLVLYGLPEPLH